MRPRSIRHDPRRYAEAGFTLIEVLVSLVLLGLVLALLSGAIRFARGTWDAAGRLDREAGYDVAGRFLRARLGEAVPLFEPTKFGAMRVAFTGTGERIDFVAPSQNGPVGSGLYRFVLEGGSANNIARALVIRLAPYQPQAGPEGAFENHVLAESVGSVTFRYFGRKDARSAPTWQDAWSRTDALPQLVEMTINRSDRGSPSVLLVDLRLASKT
jgi:general secretion pathway protein J